MHTPFQRTNKKVCEFCGSELETISVALGVCRDCIINEVEGVHERVQKSHVESRRRFGLPATPPSKGIACGQCVNDCKIPRGGKGFCGIRGNTGEGVHSLVDGAVLEWYYDPHPTNCVGIWACPAGTDVGYPRYSYSRAIEYGYKNLAVFYGACTFDCLFCQNWSYRRLTKELFPIVSAEELASKVDESTSCVCYFGGDPTPQLQHAIETSRTILKQEKITRICLETNGSMSRPLLRKIADLSYESGGCIKFDLKAWDSRIHYALCGASNKQTLDNFKWLVRYNEERGDRGVPFVIASTLLVPGYVGANEVRAISSFIAENDPTIPYSLLAFHGCYEMSDMPNTRSKDADECFRAAINEGLARVRIGNAHLLW